MRSLSLMSTSIKVNNETKKRTPAVVLLLVNEMNIVEQEKPSFHRSITKFFSFQSKRKLSSALINICLFSINTTDLMRISVYNSLVERVSRC